MDSFALPSMQMVPKSCFGVTNIKEFKWSPKDSILAYVIPEISGKPATVILLDVLADRRVQSVSFTNVNEVRMSEEANYQISIHWSPNGDFLAVKAVRYPKKKSKTLTYQISIVRLGEKNAPVEVIEMFWSEK